MILRPILAKGLCFRVGKGSSVNFWEDLWIPNNPNFKPTPNPNSNINSCGMVDSLRLENGSWNLHRLNLLFDRDTVSNIKKMFWAKESMEDELIWVGRSSGHVQVKIVYKILQPQESQQWYWWRHLWNSGIHERLKFFMWKLSSRSLLVRANLQKRKWKIENLNCPHGCEIEEDKIHLFFKCSIARAFWLATPWSSRWEYYQLASLESYFDWIANPKGNLPISPR